MLPYLAKLGITCPIYMTMPACKMGQMFLYDFVLSRTAAEDFDMFTLDDVDAVFDRATQLKHNQTEAVRGQDYGLQIMPVQDRVKFLFIIFKFFLFFEFFIFFGAFDFFPWKFISFSEFFSSPFFSKFPIKKFRVVLKFFNIFGFLTEIFRKK